MEAKNMNIEELIETFLNTIISEIWVDEENKASLRQFLYYCINSYKTGDTIPYNVLVESINEETGISLARKIADIGRKILGCNGLECTENELNQYVIDHEEKQPRIAIVSEMLSENPENWEEILKRHQVNSKIIKIYVKSGDDNTRLENDPFFRWRFLNLHVKKTRMTPADANEFMLLGLAKKGYTFEDNFKTELKEYVETVYPKAKLKEEEFVADAILAIEQRSRSLGVATKMLNSEAIPLYSRLDSEEETSLEIISTSQIETELEPSSVSTDEEQVTGTEGEECENNHAIKNVLVLALSTRNMKTEKPSKFSYNGEFEDEDCVYQLEPVTKYMMSKHRGQSLLIFELCTQKVIDEKNTTDGKTAREFFEERIKQYNKKQGLNCNLEFSFAIIDEYDTNKGLTEAVSEIKDIVPKKKDKNDQEEFWIDTHGGFRDISLMLNSLISLLKIDEKIPDRILGVRYSPDDKVTPNMIVDQMDSFQMNDFVSGMNEFIKYGSAGLLSEYYKGKKTKTTAIDEIVKAMCDVADGTKLCDPDSYISALNRLGRSIGGYKNLGVPFDIFVDYIKTDYGVLLDSRNRKNIDVIERCYKKGMYQQALTFIESLMPQEFVKNNVVYFSANVISINQEINASASERHQSREQYIFEMFVLGYLKDYVKNDSMALDVIRGRQNERNIDLYSTQRSIVINNSIKRIDNKPYVSRNITLRTDVPEEKFNKANKLILLHKAIKRVRNMTNHSKSDDNRPTISDITQALGRYVDLAKDILNI